MRLLRIGAVPHPHYFRPTQFVSITPLAYRSRNGNGPACGGGLWPRRRVPPWRAGLPPSVPHRHRQAWVRPPQRHPRRATGSRDKRTRSHTAPGGTCVVTRCRLGTLPAQADTRRPASRHSGPPQRHHGAIGRRRGGRQPPATGAPRARHGDATRTPHRQWWWKRDWTEVPCCAASTFSSWCSRVAYIVPAFAKAVVHGAPLPSPLLWG